MQIHFWNLIHDEEFQLEHEINKKLKFPFFEEVEHMTYLRRENEIFFCSKQLVIWRKWFKCLVRWWRHASGDYKLVYQYTLLLRDALQVFPSRK